RGAVRLVALAHVSVEAFIVISFLTGLPFTAAIMAWSIWYGVRGFRRSAEWGPYLSSKGASTALSEPPPDNSGIAPAKPALEQRPRE
ncbi:MAG: hypothetical protein HYR86_13290, partial [Candidatus Rokubacteria bacterium]|nr:hypothetical protein [Candidatus Rokubacteria bacterium]